MSLDKLFKHLQGQHPQKSHAGSSVPITRSETKKALRNITEYSPLISSVGH